jgi:hypothetical protein
VGEVMLLPSLGQVLRSPLQVAAKGQQRLPHCAPCACQAGVSHRVGTLDGLVLVVVPRCDDNLQWFRSSRHKSRWNVEL